MKRNKGKSLEQRLRVVKHVVKSLDPQQLENVTGGLAAAYCDSNCGDRYTHIISH